MTAPQTEDRRMSEKREARAESGAAGPQDREQQPEPERKESPRARTARKKAARGAEHAAKVAGRIERMFRAGNPGAVAELRRVLMEALGE